VTSWFPILIRPRTLMLSLKLWSLTVETTLLLLTLTTVCLSSRRTMFTDKRVNLKNGNSTERSCLINLRLPALPSVKTMTNTNNCKPDFSQLASIENALSIMSPSLNFSIDYLSRTASISRMKLTLLPVFGTLK
jgi:hypothetical protein